MCQMNADIVALYFTPDWAKLSKNEKQAPRINNSIEIFHRDKISHARSFSLQKNYKTFGVFIFLISWNLLLLGNLIRFFFAFSRDWASGNLSFSTFCPLFTVVQIRQKPIKSFRIRICLMGWIEISLSGLRGIIIWGGKIVTDSSTTSLANFGDTSTREPSLGLRTAKGGAEGNAEFICTRHQRTHFIFLRDKYRPSS